MRVHSPKPPFSWKGRHADPDTLAFLARTPTRKRFPHSTVHECLKALFRHASVFKTHRHAVYHCLKEVQKPFRHASVFKTRISTCACVCVFKTRVFAHLRPFYKTALLFPLECFRGVLGACGSGGSVLEEGKRPPPPRQDSASALY